MVDRHTCNDVVEARGELRRARAMRHRSAALSSVTAVVVSALLFAAAIADRPARAAEEATSADLARGQPAEVAAYLTRRAGCNHWAGEEGYDAERAAEIARAIRRLNCDALDRDEQRLRADHARSKNVLEALDQARDLDN